MTVEDQKPLILIVDDDPDMRLLLTSIMQREGLRVAEAEDGEACLASFNRLCPDVILLDALMPVMDGFTTCARLRNLPGGDNVPILLITGLRDEKSVDRAFEAGATDYVTKPLNRHVLRQRVRRLLHTRQAEQALLVANQQMLDRLQEVERKNRDITLLSQLGSLLQISENTQEIYSVFQQLTELIFEDDAGAFGVFNRETQQIENIFSWGTHFSQDNFGSEKCKALRRGYLYPVHNTTTEPLCHHLLRQPLPDSYVCVPLQTPTETLGLFQLYLSGNGQKVPKKILEEKERLAVTITEQTAMALANLKLQDNLRLLSIRDPLTGLYNRRYMQEALEREIRRAKRSHRSLGVIILDLDHFKIFNDTFGHIAGDLVLRSVAEFMQSKVREEDVVCRYGGEEFLLILPEISRPDLAQRAEQLRLGLQSLKINYNEEILDSVTGSLGAALYPDHGGTAEQVIETADAALYQAKQQGRNRVILAE
jgi:diguanylate cyclase (GGDEF)-like protein